MHSHWFGLLSRGVLGCWQLWFQTARQTSNANSVIQVQLAPSLGPFPSKVDSREIKELGDKVRFVRRRKQLTQQNMADGIGMSCAKQYSRYESGETKLDMELLERIAKEFDLSLAELLAYDEGISFNHCKQANSICPNCSYHEVDAKVYELYEARLKEQGERIKQLKKGGGFFAGAVRVGGAWALTAVSLPHTVCHEHPSHTSRVDRMDQRVGGPWSAGFTAGY